MQLPKKTISANTKITVKRMLPVTGEVLVQRGQKVEASTIVAAARLPRRYQIIQVARQLALSADEMNEVLRKAEGEPVEANEVIAVAPGGLPLFRRSVRAPAAGRIAKIGPGWLMLETQITTLEIQAFVNGTVSWIAPEQGVVIESTGALVEAVCGFGGEAYGLMKRLTNSPFDTLTEDAIDASCQNTIILGGRTLDEAALRKAEKVKARGIIVGSFDAALMNLDPLPKVRLIATEGFGNLSMAPYTFGILRSLSGKEVAMRALTPGLTSGPGAPDEMPPIIVAGSSRSVPPGSVPQEQEIQIGSRVRITRGKLQGSQGTVSAIPAATEATAAGVVASGAYIKIDDAISFVPWSNLEQVV